ncbi:hypothetical protein [Aliiglaciecola litoralis]|uniref:Solute-binding protein family 3/N-terminal domain-containing protein n=1 Tax=Aliiglaciecola litoralis TaxID=582857 RepID=A0ABN1LBW0_9ALTE
MTKWLLFFTILVLVSFNVLSQTGPQESSIKPQFRISYINYPDVREYVELIEGIYTDLGFRVRLLPVPPSRGLMLLNEGKVDADVVRLKATIVKYPNLLVVTPALQDGELSLICLKETHCNREMLDDENVNILINDGVLNLFDANELRAHPIVLDRIEKFPKLIKAKRHLYALYVVDELMHREMEQNYQLVTIKSAPVHHAINKKHAALLPMIEEKLRERLPALQESRR